MEYEDFYLASSNLKCFLKEKDKLTLFIKLLSSDSSGYFDFGDKFIDDYISLLQLALGDKSDWFSWFVFENEFGKNELEVLVNGINYKICNEKQFYDIFIKANARVL
jgi:hypothetical protein